MVQFGAIRSRLETMRNRELTGNLGLFCADLGVFPPCNSLYSKWLDGDSLFRKNREFQMTDQGIALDEQGIEMTDEGNVTSGHHRVHAPSLSARQYSIFFSAEHSCVG